MRNTFVILLVLLITTSCDPYKRLSEKRAQKASALKGDIVIGIVDTSSAASFLKEGINLAIEHINNQGGVLGKKISPVYYDDKGDVLRGQEIARKISKNTDIIAVVGHISSKIAIPASVTYEKTGVLLISPKATNPELTQYNHQYIFANIPSDIISAYEIAGFVKRRGYKKVAIIYDRDSYADRLASAFHKYAVDAGINIVADKSYSGWEDDFRLLISDIMEKYELDCIFLGGVLPSGANMVKQMREMGITVPIIGSDTFDSQRLLETAGNAAEGVISYSVFDPSLPKTQTGNFVHAFKTKYGVMPDTEAAQGYDAMRVLAYSIQKSGTAVPVVVGSTLRLLKNWKSVTGSYSFEHSGSISGKTFFFKMVKDGKFEFLESELTDKINIFKPIVDRTIRIPIEKKVKTLDPGFAEEKNSIDIIEQLFLGLTDLDPTNYEPVPELAQSWTISDDGLIYRFMMRKDAKWTNNEPVTAHDIVWAVRRNIKPETDCRNANLLYILKNGADIHNGEIKEISQIGVHAIDDFTIEFELERPNPYFPATAGLPPYRPLPRKIIQKYKDKWTDPQNIQTNGSYSMGKWKKGMVVILTKNDDYFDSSKVSIPEIRYYVIPESSVGLTMYYDNKLDILGGNYLQIPVAELLSIRANKQLAKHYSKNILFGTYAYGFNVKQPPVDNLLVRKAITACINRELIISLVTKNEEEPALTFVSSAISNLDNSKENIGIKFDPVQAKKWLIQAGYPNGKGFPEITLSHGDSQEDLKIAKAVRSFLNHYLKIDVRLVDQNPSGNTTPGVKKHSAHIFSFKTGGSVYPVNSLDHTGWNNRHFKSLINRANKESNLGIRKKLYKEAEKILLEKACAVAPVYYDTAHYLVMPRVEGWYHMNIGGQHVRNWSLKK